MTPAEELRHLREGAGGRPPPSDSDVLEVPGGERTLQRARQVLEPLLGHEGSEWPGVEEWRRRLPDWFTGACVDDVQVRDCVLDKWSLRAWVYWFRPDLRKWRWWDAEVDDDRLSITLLVEQRPYLRGALEWLLAVARNP
jgi:hypothetical protein